MRHTKYQNDYQKKYQCGSQWKKKGRALGLSCLSALWVILFLGGCGGNRGAILPVEQSSVPWEEAKEENTSGREAGSGTDILETETVRQADLGSAQPTEHKESYVTVHVCGAVKAPGVYKVEAGSRLMEAVQAAGGILEGGAGDYLNLAAVVYDGEKIVVPYLDEVDSPYGEAGTYSGENVPENGSQEAFQPGAGQQGAGESGKVNINTADAALLQTLPGIGASKAAAIIEYREGHGAFSDIEEIKNVPGIKEGAYKKIKDYIIV